LKTRSFSDAGLYFRKFFWTALFILTLMLLQAPALKAQGRGLLWHASDGKGHELYVLGSFHVAKSSMFPLSSAINEAFARSTQLAVELDAASLDPASLMEAGFNPPGVTLDSQLTPDTQALLKTVSFLPDMVLQQMRPWLAAMTLEVLTLQEAGYSEEYGLDLYFMGQAKNSGRPVIELESFEEQMAIFTGMSAQENDLYLKATLNELSQGASVMDRMYSMWTAGNAAGFYDIVAQSFQKHPELTSLNDRLITQRNFTMTSRLAKLFLQENQITFVVVGAAHTVGPGGIPALLTRAGLTVRQM
jgi:uncharacterized protein YbaP (TraB family)